MSAITAIFGERAPWLFLALWAISLAAIFAMILLPFWALQGSVTPKDSFLSGPTSGPLLELLAALPAFGFSLSVTRQILRTLSAVGIAAAAEFAGDSAFTPKADGFQKFCAFALVPVLPLCFFCSISYWALTPYRIEVRPLFSATIHTYDWSQVHGIATSCTSSKNGDTYHYVLSLNEGIRIDAIPSRRFRFLDSFAKFQAALEGHTYFFDNSRFIATSCARRASPEWRAVLAQPPTAQPSVANP